MAQPGSTGRKSWSARQKAVFRLVMAGRQAKRLVSASERREPTRVGKRAGGPRGYSTSKRRPTWRERESARRRMAEILE